MGSHHRRALLAAIALGLLIAMLGVGRARADGAEGVWTHVPAYAFGDPSAGRSLSRGIALAPRPVTG
jgi:hypothetical protein